jgi:integrase/recombinase XerC/integrase/recombinase XerD
MSCRTEGKTRKTIRDYEEKLGRFVRWHGGTLANLSVGSVRDFIAHLQSATRWDGHCYTPTRGELLSPSTVAHHVRVVKGFATWLHEEEYTSENLLSRISVPKVPRKMIEVLTSDEVRRLLAGTNRESLNGPRDLAIVVLMLDTGMRCGELLSLGVEDVHFEDQWLRVMGKGQKERTIPFGARCSMVLARYLRFSRPNIFAHQQLFLTIDGEPISENTIKMLFTRLRKRTGIARLHPHLLRHTFATSYLVAGGDVFTLQSILGHTTLEMTRRYVTLASSHVNIQHRRFSPMDRVDAPALRTRRLQKPISPQGRGYAERILPLDGRRPGGW